MCVQSEARIFIPGQTAYFVDDLGRAHECTVDGYHGEEIFVSKEGKPFGWFSDDTLFHSTDEAYEQLSSRQ